MHNSKHSLIWWTW